MKIYENDRWKTYLRSYPLEKRSELSHLGAVFGTDKAGPEHNYTEVVYTPLFREIRNEPIKLLEIGSGDIGASLFMWRKYFPNAEIYCLEPFFNRRMTITPAKLEAEGIIVIKGNQMNRDDLNRAGKMSNGGFDVIIDDGAHNNDAQQISLGGLFPYLKGGGLYIIEDLHSAVSRGRRIKECNQWLASSGDIIDKKQVIFHKRDKSIGESSTELIITKKWDSYNLSKEENQYLSEKIKQIFFFDDPRQPGMDKICVFEKHIEENKENSIIKIPTNLIKKRK